jgi:hypothetical protein
MKELKNKSTGGIQSTLDGVLEKQSEKLCTREGVTHTVAQFIVCDDQVQMAI